MTQKISAFVQPQKTGRGRLFRTKLVQNSMTAELDISTNAHRSRRSFSGQITKAIEPSALAPINPSHEPKKRKNSNIQSTYTPLLSTRENETDAELIHRSFCARCPSTLEPHVAHCTFPSLSRADTPHSFALALR